MTTAEEVLQRKRQWRRELAELRRSVAALDFSRADQRAQAAPLRVEIASRLLSLGCFESAARAAKWGSSHIKQFGGSISHRAEGLNILGIADWNLHRPAQGLPSFQEAQSLFARANVSIPIPLRITIESNLALALHETGALDMAIIHQQNSLSLAQENGDESAALAATRRIANIHQDEGRRDLARDILNSVPPTEDTDNRDQIAWYNASAMLAERDGEIFKADEYFRQGVKYFNRVTPPPLDMTSVLSNAALLFVDLGQVDEAQQVLQVYDRLMTSTGTLNARLGLIRLRATMAYARGELDEAAHHWQQGETLLKQNAKGNIDKLASISTTRARILWELGRRRDALQLVGQYAAGRDDIQAGPDKRQGFRLEPSICFGQYLIDLGRRDEAAPVLKAAFQIASIRQDPDQEWRLVSALADLARRSNKSQAAILFGKLAVRCICRMSGPITGSRREQSAFLESRLLPFHTLIDALVTQARFPEAEHILVLAKSEQLFDLVRRDTVFAAQRNSPFLRLDEEQVLAAYDEHRETTRHLFNSQADESRPKAERDRDQAALNETPPHARALLAKMLNETWTAPRVQRDQPILKGDVRPGHAVMVFLPTLSGITVHVRSAQGEDSYPIARDPKSLSKDIFKFRQAIEMRHRDYKRLGRTLYDLLIRPAEKYIANVQQIEINAKGALSYLPFACLMRDERYLIEKASLVFRTGAGQIKAREPERLKHKIAAFGATGSNGPIDDLLLQVTAELESIAALAPDARIGKDAAFTAQALTDALAADTTILHIASHFNLVPAAAHLSALQLGDGTELSLAQLRHPKFDFSNIELLILSCCDTATSDEGLNGTESLAGLAHMKGARDVIATLWPVTDHGAATLMHNFYDLLLVSEKSAEPAQCLALAQRRLIDGTVQAGTDPAATGPSSARSFGKRREPAALDHPFYWAGFAAFAPGH